MLAALFRHRGWLPSDASPEFTVLRLPVLLGSAEEKTALLALGAREGLGVSPSYPAPINEIPEIRDRFAPTTLSGARTLATRLVTFPVHRLVTAADYARTATVLDEAGASVGRLSMRLPRPFRTPALKAA